MKVEDFDYELPPRYIAQTPAEPRDSAKLLHLDRETGEISHYVFSDIVDLLLPKDVLVLNNTRVIPARLYARKAKTGGKVEILLLKRLNDVRWQALVSGRNVNVGTQLSIADSDVLCEVVERQLMAQRIVEFNQPITELLGSIGEMPLPPYITSTLEDDERYQTVYSETDGSAAAPTAGLHFTTELLGKLRKIGVWSATCTLHVGLDTFQPVTAENVRDHRIHSEYAELDSRNAAIINEGKLAGGRTIAVGTTSARTLETAAIHSAGDDPAASSEESAADKRQPVTPIQMNTSLFIYPGYQWRAVDAMITNFHLPRSTLLMMLSAFAGRETILNSYETAKRMNYRFYSFGDAIFVT